MRLRIVVMTGLIIVFAFCTGVSGETTATTTPTTTTAAAISRVRDATGRVFEDANENGRYDSGETGIEGVLVSDGCAVVSTGPDGLFSFRVDPAKNPFVFICTPAGYRNSRSFYLRVTRDAKEYPFGLISSPEMRAESFSFVHITDIHVGMSADSDQTFLEDLKEITSQPGKPHFIISTGDLVNSGSDRPSYEKYCQMTRDSGIPFYHVIGNHDLPMTNYEEFLGPTYYSFDYGAKHFVVLNCLEAARYAEWLQKDLDQQPKTKGIFVFQHFPPDKKLLDLLSGYKVEGFFYGHWHSNKVFHYGKMPVVCTTPLRFGGIDCNPRGYRLVTVDRDGSLRMQFLWSGGKATAGKIPDGIQGLAWSTSVGGETGMSCPQVADGRLYIGVQDDHNAQNAGVVCLDSRSGKLIWKYKTTSSVNGTPAIQNGIVCAVCVDGTIWGLDAGSGKEIWKSELGPFYDRWIYSSPVIADGVVYCGSAPCFKAIDLKTGKTLWQAAPMGPDWISCRTNPAVDENRVYVGVNWSNGLFCLDRKNGNVVWNNKSGYGTSHCSPAIVGKMVFYSADGQLYALDKAGGKELWHTALNGGWSVSTPVVQDGMAVIGTPDGKIESYDVQTGKRLWSVSTGEAQGSFSPYMRGGSQIMSSPTIAEGKVYAGGNDGILYVIDVKTGQCLEKTALGYPILSSPAVVGKTVIIARWDGVIMAIHR